jgi:hypothetical protein
MLKMMATVAGDGVAAITQFNRLDCARIKLLSVYGQKEE